MKLVISTPDAPLEQHPFLPTISCGLCGAWVQPDPEEIFAGGKTHWDELADVDGSGSHFTTSELQQEYLDAMSAWSLAHKCAAAAKKETS